MVFTVRVVVCRVSALLDSQSKTIAARAGCRSAPWATWVTESRSNARRATAYVSRDVLPSGYPLVRSPPEAASGRDAAPAIGSRCSAGSGRCTPRGR